MTLIIIKDWVSFTIKLINSINGVDAEINRIYDGIEAETSKSQASFQIIQNSFEALPSMRLEYFENEPEISMQKPEHHH